MFRTADALRPLPAGARAPRWGRNHWTVVFAALAVTVTVFAGGLVFLAARSAATPGPQAPPRVVVGVAGLRWADVAAAPQLAALVDRAHVGSVTVNTVGSRTCPVAGWLTINAGTRAVAGDTAAACPGMPAVSDGRVTGWRSYVDQQATHHTGARLGLLGGRPGVCGFGPGGAVATANGDGVATRWAPQFQPQALAGCQLAVVDAGQLPSGDARTAALASLAKLVTDVTAVAGGPVLLVGVADEPTDDRQLLVALQVLPGGGTGNWLTSGSTRRHGLVQLADITATLLPDETVDGARITVTDDAHPAAAAVVDDRLATNQRYALPWLVLGLACLVLPPAQVLALTWFWRRRSPAARRAATFTLLAQGGFFAAVFLVTATGWWRSPVPAVTLLAATLAASAVIAAAAHRFLGRFAAIGVAAVAYVTLLVDGVLGTPLQLGSMFSDGPVIGGRLYGFGNSTFAALAVGTVGLAGAVAAALVRRGHRTAAAVAVLGIGGAAIVVSGITVWGADFGGVVALTPGVLLLAWLAWRDRISLRVVAGLGLAGVAAVSAFALVDYARPAQQRSHFGAFVARLVDGGATDVFWRKLQMSFAFLNTPQGWLALAAFLAGAVAVWQPHRVPSRPYRDFLARVPMARPTLLCLVFVGAIGMVLNDAGVMVPIIMMGFAVPLLVAMLLSAPEPAGGDGPPRDGPPAGETSREPAPVPVGR